MEKIYQQVAKDILGYPGKMISGSKSFYREKFPDHVVVFNSNIFVGKTKIWFGDLDITESIDNLKDLALSLGEKVYILFEYDGRFDKEKNPSLDNAVITIGEHGEVSLHENLQESIDKGKLKLKWQA